MMEIQFQYTNSRETLLQMKQNVQVLLNSALGYVEGQASEQLKAERLYAFLRPLFVQTGPSATPVYSLLCVGVGDSLSLIHIYHHEPGDPAAHQGHAGGCGAHRLVL